MVVPIISMSRVFDLFRLPSPRFEPGSKWGHLTVCVVLAIRLPEIPTDMVLFVDSTMRGSVVTILVSSIGTRGNLSAVLVISLYPYVMGLGLMAASGSYCRVGDKC